MSDVLVVGAGVVGTALTYRLARAGAEVTLLDSGAIGAGTSAASFSVDITTRKTPKALFDLSLRGVGEHQALQQELTELVAEPAPSRLPVAVYEWGDSDETRQLVSNRVGRLQSWGYRAEWVDADDLRTAEPGLVVDPAEAQAIVRYPDSAWYDAPLLARQLAEAATRLGARVLPGQTVTGVRMTTGRVTGVATAHGREHSADVVAVCSGPRTDDVVAMAGAQLPLLRIPGLVGRSAPVPAGTLSSAVLTPYLSIRPGPSRTVVSHSYPVEAEMPPVPASGVDTEYARALASAAGRMLPELAGSPLADARIGVRPVPLDGLPVVGRMPEVDGLYVLVTHSGAHLAPILGRYAADDILGSAADTLGSFRPTRSSLQGGGEHGELDESTREMNKVLRPSSSYTR